MKKEIKIGKFTLESLTTGMYSDSRVIFREYIQNATDALDNAIKQNLIKAGEDRIDISIDPAKKSISIKDNGTGIKANDVWNILGDIGNSSKRFSENRGFRGIGRLGGLSYADELQFVTSAKGENKRTVYYWDCKKLRELLQPGKYEDYDLTRVIEEISVITDEPEEESLHYLDVRLEGINEKYLELIDVDGIKDYLSQVAPVPFDSQKFPYFFDSHEGIRKRLESIGKKPEEYNIFLNGDPNPIYKPYKTRISVDKKHDDIKGIEFFEGKNENNEYLFFGWYAKTNWLGSVSDKAVKGLRVRKNNILIGDETTLNDFFSESRFNGWVVGEVYVYDPQILPNARRDNFENNEEYVKFKNKLEEITKQQLSKLPRQYSNNRNEQKAIEKAKQDKDEIEEIVKKGVTSDKQKEELFKKLDSIKKITEPKKNNKKESSKDINKGREKLDKEKETLGSDLLDLENKIIDAEYRTKDIPSSYSREVKKVVSVIFEVIDETLQKEEAEKLTDKIIEKLKIKTKEEKKSEKRYSPC